MHRRLAPFLLGLLVALVGCGQDATPPVDTFLPGGFTDVSPDGSYGVLTTVQGEGDNAHEAILLVRISDLPALKFRTLRGLPSGSRFAHFCADSAVASMVQIGTDWRLDVTSVSDTLPEPGWSALLARLNGAGITQARYRLSDHILVVSDGQVAATYRVSPSGATESLATFPAAAFPVLSSQGSDLLFYLNYYGEDKRSRQWDVELVISDPVDGETNAVIRSQSCYGRIVQAGDALYVLSSRPDFIAGNVWKCDPSTGEMLPVTEIEPPRFVSDYHVLEDSVAVLVRDPDRPAGNQYQYEYYPR